MIEIIYENKDWLPFFENALKEIDVEYRLNFIEEFDLDLNQPPDDIIYLNRISPSSHTRGHDQTFIKGEQYLEYLAAYNRKVINNQRTLNYEISKVEQIRLLKRSGLAYPRTVFSSEIDELIKTANTMPLPLLTKHNCSGDGLGIKRFNTVAELEEYLKSDRYIKSPDGVLLLQEYIKPKDDFITHVEIIDERLVYAYLEKTDRSESIYIPDFEHPMVEKYIEIAVENGFDMVGMEFIESANGGIFTYDINATTNYSPDVERQSGNKAKLAFQDYIKKLIQA